MGYTIDAAGNIIQTSNTGVVGSNFIPNVYEQPIGALNSVGRQMYTENEDGTVTAPIYSLTSNTPTFDIGSMASIYGTKYMPMFEWVSQKQTGSVTFDPQEGSIGSDEIQDQIEEFENETGMTPQEALKKQQEEMLKAEVKATVGAVASNVGQNLGRAVAAGGGPGDLTLSSMWSAGKEGPTSVPKTTAQLSDIKAATDAQDALKAGIADINNKEISNVQKDIEIKALQAKSPAPVATASWGSNIKDRFDPTSAAGKSTLYSAYGAGGATFLTGLLSGDSAIDAAKQGLKVGAATYIGTALLGPLGGLIGGILGGRVICNELMRQGVMTREHVVLDYRFTRDYLTPTHVKGYHVWAVWMVKQMRNGRMVKLWAHVAGHRANEIAHIYGKRDKPDYLGKVYRKILEPICWSIGLFCKQTDWSILYKTKEI
jgi:predicted hydrocarbon binding protein